MGRTNMVAVLPVAAIEQHGPHLPLSVDRDILEGLIAATLPLLPDDLPVVFLPTQAIGKSDEHARYPGTLTIGAETLIRAWCEIGGLGRRGRGQEADPAQLPRRPDGDARHRRARAAHPPRHGDGRGQLVRPRPARRRDRPPTSARHGIHAGEMETAMMLALHPEKVEMEPRAHTSNR